MTSLNKTFLSPKLFNSRNWFIIDCKKEKLGRLSSIVVMLLKGKVKPNYYPSMDMGDYVILINADSILVNEKSKHYIVSNPGRPGNSLKVKNVSDCLSKFTIKKSIKGMLSKTETKRLLKRLYIYKNQNHCHQAQNPVKIDVSNFYLNSSLSEKLNQ